MAVLRSTGRIKSCFLKSGLSLSMCMRYISLGKSVSRNGSKTEGALTNGVGGFTVDMDEACLPFPIRFVVFAIDNCAGAFLLMADEMQQLTSCHFHRSIRAWF